jgi:predicted ATPase
MLIANKICISGSQNTGKSTLLKAIEKRSEFKDHEFIKEVVRTLMKEGVKINKFADHDSQIKILLQHYKNCLHFHQMITDRSAVDAFVYATWDYIYGHFTYKEHKEQEEIFLRCLPFYKLHFFLPIEFNMEEDGVRNTEPTYQKEISDIFHIIFNRYQIPYITLSGSVENRLTNFLTECRNERSKFPFEKSHPLYTFEGISSRGIIQENNNNQ